MIDLFKNYQIPLKIIDFSFGDTEVNLISDRTVYSSKLWYKIRGQLDYYELHLNKKQVLGKYDYREGKIFSLTEYKFIDQENLLRYLDIEKFWPSEDEYKVYRFGDVAEIILKKPTYNRPGPKSIRSVAQLLGPSSDYCNSCFPSPLENHSIFDLYINGEKTGYRVSASKDGCGDIYILPGREKLTKEHIKKYLVDTGKLL